MNYSLHHGDAFAYMDSMADASIDHIITDPPYANHTHQGARSQKDVIKPFIDFDCFTDDQFIRLCQESVRISRRWVIMTCEWRHALLAEQSNLPMVRLGCWVKPNAAPQVTGDRPGTDWEAVLILHGEGKKRWNGGGHHGVWTCNIVQVEHPTQKPLPLLKKWIHQFTDPGETIGDFLMGSGSTGMAALQLQRQFLGCEQNVRFYNLAERRMAQVAMQTHLLAI